MFQSDVLMRQVQQAAQVIARIMMLRQTGQVDEALHLLEETGARLLDLDARSITAYTYDDVAGRLDETSENDRELMAVLAEMLRHLGELRALRDESAEARHSLHLALHLEMRLATGRRKALAPDDDPVDSILAQLDLAELDAPLFPPLISHYERAGRFADAEDMLFFWLERAQPDLPGALHATGRAFYDRLRQHSDETLAAGDFSRQEVVDGERAFREATER